MSKLDLLQRMELECREKGLFSAGAGIVIACSGGADSIALADLLRRLGAAWKLRLCMAHFEHGIRGRESEEDAEFVRKLADAWGIPFRMASGNVPEYAKEHHLSLETAARELRHGFFQDVCRDLAYDAIALAHHADDQAETVLMRILRGSGLKGLAAMHFRQGNLVRPLLSFRKQELLDYCESRGLNYRDDRTNAVPDVVRNRLRLELFPKLREEYNPSIQEALCQLARLASETQDFLYGELGKVWPHVVRRQAQWELSREAFLKLHPAMQRMLLQAYLEHVFGDVRDIGFRHYESLRQLLLQGRTGTRMELPHARMLELSYGWLTPVHAKKQDYPMYPVKIPGCTELWEYGLRMMTEIREAKPEQTGAFEYYCDFDQLREMPVVRTRWPGDRLTAAGGTKKLKEYFIDCKLRREQRDCQPLLVCGKDLLWVIGRRRSSLFQPDEHTKHVLYVRVEREGGACHDGR